jgi:retron-type reverse transcriptase
MLYPFFERTFISDSFSCRIGKGTHKAVNRFRSFAYKVSKNNTKTAWVLKCDIKKFFANIDHKILFSILSASIPNTDVLALIKTVIESFSSGKVGVGLPLGNLTSQLFVNIYMNEFDQFVKHKLKVRYYIRYADDFIILSRDRNELEDILRYIVIYLGERLKLELHPNKVFIKTFASGADFLGWVHSLDHRVLRTSTKKRMFRHIGPNVSERTVASYLGLLKHGNSFGLKEKIRAIISSNEVSIYRCSCAP